MMATRSPETDYTVRREALATYFDSTAKQAWIDLTSDAKVSGIRATVRAGRKQMRATLVGWLPTDLRRTRILDAGCGTGALAIDVACRGADVTAVDVAGGLVEVARQRAPGFIGHGKVRWRAGDSTMFSLKSQQMRVSGKQSVTSLDVTVAGSHEGAAPHRRHH